MNDFEISREEAVQTLIDIKCRHDSKEGLNILDRQLWMELVNKFLGILREVETQVCPNEIPEVFRRFLHRLTW